MRALRAAGKKVALAAGAERSLQVECQTAHERAILTMLRPLLRACVLGLALLFGVPAASLVLARIGALPLPSDPYLRSLREGAPPAAALQDYSPALGTAGTVVTPLNVVARAAIVETADQLPGHEAAPGRELSFYRIYSGYAYVRTVDAYASVPAPGDDGDGERERRIWISARVISMEDDRARVLVRWTTARPRMTGDWSATRQLVNPLNKSAGEFTVTLTASNGAWRAAAIEPRR